MRAMAYPKELEGDVELRDGARVHIRPIRQDDETRLIGLYDRLSRDTAYQRFFTVMHRLPPDWARYLAAVDYVRRLALVVGGAADPEAEVIAVARYEPSDEPNTAEVPSSSRTAGRAGGSARCFSSDCSRRRISAVSSSSARMSSPTIRACST